MKYTATQIKEWGLYASTKHGWIPARGINHEYESMLSRLKNSICVLTGRYDVIDWQDRPEHVQPISINLNSRY